MNGSSGGASGSGASTGGSSSNGGANGAGGNASGAAGSAGAGGNRTSTGGEGGAATGGTQAGSGGAPAASATCKNPAHTLPLNPANAQDGVTIGNFYVDTDTWNAANYPVTQTMYVCDYGNWYVVANMNNDSGDGAVKTYPNVHEDFSSSPRIDSYASISSSFAHTGPHVGIYEFAYDIWLNGIASSGSTEIMIWTDNFKQVPSGSKADTVTFDGQSYDVYHAGSYIAFVDTENVTSGTLNLLSFFNYVIGKGWIPASSTLGAIDYGVELVSTGGADATFTVSDFTLTLN